MKIPLSFIIEYTAQIIFPTLYRLFVIKPIFPKQRDNLVINYEFHPFFCTGDPILSTEIAVTDLKSFPQGIILFYLLIQLYDLFDQVIEYLVLQGQLIGFKPVRMKSRGHFKKAETPPQGVINHCKAPVCRVHHTNDI